MNYQFHSAAADEHLDHIAFYESRQRGLGADYLAEFESAMMRICASPLSYQIECAPNIRKAVMPRFPFNVLFREGNGVIQILSVAHQRHRPRYWINRTG